MVSTRWSFGCEYCNLFWTFLQSKSKLSFCERLKRTRLTDEDGRLRQLITLEQEDRFQVCFPALVESFLQHTEDLKAAKSKRTRKTKPKKDTDALAEDMEALVINSDSKHHQMTAVVAECFLRSFDDCETDSQSGQPQSLAGAGLKSEKLSSCHRVENQCSSIDSEDAVFETIGQTSLVDELERKVQGNCSSTKNSSTRDISVEYVPLSQRLEALTKGREADRECSGVTNLDDSYTYIPLSQRLKARLGSSNQQRSTSSSTSASSCEGERSLTKDRDSASQGNSVVDLDSSYTFIPLSQRLKARLGSRDQQSSKSSSTSSCKDVQSLSSCNTEHNEKSSQKPCLQSAQLQQNKVSVPDDKTQTAKPCASQSSAVHRASKLSLEKCVPSHGMNSLQRSSWADSHKPGKTGTELPECLIDTVSFKPTAVLASSKESSEQFNGLQDPCKTVESKTKNSILPPSQSSENQEKRACKVADGVHSKKQLTKKKVQSSREEKDMVLCSQKSSKAAVLSDLLEDWSDSDEDETSKGENCDSLLDTEQKVVGYSTVSVTNTFENKDFSTSSQQKPEIYMSLSEEHTENVTPLLPYDTNVCGSERREELDLSQDAPSFISDGHFTLRHSFFTSMAESDVSKDSSALGDRDSISQHCFTPESRVNHQTGATHHDSFTTASFNALSDSLADLVLDTPQLPVSRAKYVSNTQTTSKTVKSNYALLMAADSSIASSPDAHVHKSDLIDVEKEQLQSVSVALGHDSVNHQVLRQYSTSTTASVLLGTFSSKTVTSGDSVSVSLSTISSKAVASSCDSSSVSSYDVMIGTKLSVRQGGSSAGGESSVPTSSSSSLEKEAPVIEAHEIESSLDVSFLPLSQRLRLKKPNAKLLKSLNNL